MEIKDQMGRVLEIDFPARRIVSLVPSQTEFLATIGLDDEVIGITKFCIHPDNWWKSKMRVGGTKNPDIAKIKFLQPDLIIGNKEENDLRTINELESIAPVWMSDIATLEDSYNMMSEIGKLVAKKNQALEIVTEIQHNFRNINQQKTILKVVYFIWRKPWMVAGKSTFIDSILHEIGLTNGINEVRYPILNPAVNNQIDYVFLSSEPFPFTEKHIKELKPFFPNAQFKIVDGEMFSWYGSRLLKAPNYFQKLLGEL